jgi:membrane fusion protein (multidrug efflux system)
MTPKQLKHIAYFSSIVLALFLSCNEKKPQAVKPPAPAKKIELVNPIMDQPTYTLELPGELKPYEVVTLYPKIKGFVKHIYVDRGSKVKRGQLLALLEAPEISQQYLAAKSDEHKFHENYLYSRLSYDRLKKAASRSGVVAEIELDRARSKFKSDSAAYAAVKANSASAAQLKQYLRILAPFDGFITSKNVSLGALVGENTQLPLFSLAQTSQLRLTVAIPEKHAHSISKNMEASFSVSDQPGKFFSAKFSRKSNLLLPDSRAVTVEFDVPNGQQQFGGGEYTQVKLNMRRDYPSLWLPVSSVVQSQSGIFVIKIENARVRRIPASTGIRKGDLQEVFAELTVDDQVAKVGSEELIEGDKI